MLISCKHKFIFFSLPKTGTTSIESALTPHCDIVIKSPPKLKHTTNKTFNARMLPMLKATREGYKGYEKYGVIREPLERLLSWYSYLSRKELTRKNHGNAKLYTGNISFDEFIESYLRPKSEQLACTSFIGPSNFFYENNQGVCDVEKLFKYENIDMLIEDLEERIGKSLNLPFKNVSRKKELVLNDSLRERLYIKEAKSLELYKSAF